MIFMMRTGDNDTPWNLPIPWCYFKTFAWKISEDNTKLVWKKNKKVTYNGNIHRRLNNSNTTAYITNNYIDDRIAKVATVIKNEKVYKICLRYLCNLGKINLSCKNKLENNMFTQYGYGNTF